MARWARTGTPEARAKTAKSRGAPAPALIQPTPDEIKNGWDAEALTRYVHERNHAAAQSVLEKPKEKPRKANARYNPHRWRG